MTKLPFLLTAALLPGVLYGQAKSEPRPVFALHAGVGGHQGWIGGAAEFFVVPGRLSAWVGAGVLPGFGLTTATAAALRWYQPAMETHRLFVDASWTLVEIAQPLAGPYRTYRRYAEGVMFGYSYLGRSGLSLTAGGGVAGLISKGGAVPLLHLAVGWTWRS